MDLIDVVVVEYNNLSILTLLTLIIALDWLSDRPLGHVSTAPSGPQHVEVAQYVILVASNVFV